MNEIHKTKQTKTLTYAVMRHTHKKLNKAPDDNNNKEKFQNKESLSCCNTHPGLLEAVSHIRGVHSLSK